MTIPARARGGGAEMEGIHIFRLLARRWARRLLLQQRWGGRGKRFRGDVPVSNARSSSRYRSWGIRRLSPEEVGITDEQGGEGMMVSDEVGGLVLSDLYV